MSNSAKPEKITFGGLMGIVGLLRPMLQGGKLVPTDLIGLITSILGAVQGGAPAKLTAGLTRDALTASTLQQLITDVTSALSDGHITLREAMSLVRDIAALAAEFMGEDAASSFGFPAGK